LRRILLVIVILGSVLAAVPAWGDSGSSLPVIEAREAADRVQLNLAVASDNAVEAEALRLQSQVALEQSIVAGDESAAAAADAAAFVAGERLSELESAGRADRQALVARAVYLYEHPFSETSEVLEGATSFDEIEDRQVLADAVQGQTDDLVDAVRASSIQETAAVHQLDTARALADRTAAEEEGEYGRLLLAQASEASTHQALQARITDDDASLLTLSAQQAAIEGELNANSSQYAAEIADAGADAGIVLGPVGSYGLQWPIHGVVTQEFGHNGHPGIDIAAPWGTPIHASGSGVVIYASWEEGYGNYTCINHGGGISTCYGHQSYIGVTVGEVVTRGEVIGREGSTGYSTGPHVHFEVRVNGIVHNPRLFIPGNP
jgi:murein DD-endopeptidase MepM/ murein hydrolase activator NlpD